jgi:hypothetical protein
MITITHKSGPLAGTSQSFDDAKARIEFGRDPDNCDVVYPPDATAVGRQHFALARDASGDWTLHLYGDHFVSVDKVLAQQNQPLRSGSVLHLGPTGGPDLRIVVERPAAKDGKVTDPQPQPVPASVMARRLTIAGGVITVALIAIVGGWIAKTMADKQQTEATMASLAKDQTKAQEDLAHMRNSAAASFDQSVIDHLQRATFLVFKRDAQGNKSIVGTAWVLSPTVLATNAHIAARCDELPARGKKPGKTCQDLKPGDALFVQAPGAGGATYEVIKHSFHPGYVGFPELMRSADPAIANMYYGPMQVDVGYTHDVGLLYIKGTLADDLPLQVASKDELLALKPGMFLASSGYLHPEDVLMVSATPQVHYGNIGALTDFMFLPTDPAHSYLIQHSIPEDVEGGSGSPIINPAGHVIAIHNAGNVGATGAPSGVEINYAQRADLAADLLAGRGEAAYAADKPYWLQQMGKFKRGIDAWSAKLLAEDQPSAKAVAQLVFEAHDKLAAADKRPGTKERARTRRFDLTAGTHYSVFVYAANQTPIEIFLKDGKDQTIASKTNSQWHPILGFTPSTSGSWSLVIVGPDADTSFTTRLYSWQSSGS